VQAAVYEQVFGLSREGREKLGGGVQQAGGGAHRAPRDSGVVYWPDDEYRQRWAW
jgi:hypothetical protein